MKALQSLTDLFRQHVTDAAKLDVWAEDGALFATPSHDIDGFEVEYTAIVFLQNVNIAPQILMMHLVVWLCHNDPHRHEKGLAFPSFALERLDTGHFDIKIKIDLQEAYSLQADDNGNWKQRDQRFTCVSDFTPAVDDDQLNELVYFVGHQEDLP